MSRLKKSAYLLFALNLAGKGAAVALYDLAPWVAISVWVITDVILLYHLLVPGAQGLVRVYRSFATKHREVWLTIDDGPDPEDTPRVLSLLKEHHARATFFVIGQRAEEHPELIRAMMDAGHEVAHHTHTHPLATFWCASPARLKREIMPPLELFLRMGMKPRWFRSPAGMNNFWLQRELDDRGLHCVGWSVRGLECASRSAEEVVERVTRQVSPGSIILLHEGPNVPPKLRLSALQGVLEHLRAEDYACVLPALNQLRQVAAIR
ncbi:polysaccharide deacetylase family protein [Oleiharenicola lentus]|uniref:polysaccharide deacetylase family protein n=1 Tax=Oleiharenicola lentus TaxID=2508720 RepID=UPI003F6619D7